MPYVIDYDQPVVLYKLNPDNETASMNTVLGKKAYDNAILDGWQESCPKLKYPTMLYQEDGATQVAQNRAEEEAFMGPHRDDCKGTCRQHGWDHIVRAAPVAPPENYGPLVEPKKGDVDLALALMGEQEKRMTLENQVTQLTALVEKLLAAPAAAPARGKPGPKPKAAGAE